MDLLWVGTKLGRFPGARSGSNLAVCVAFFLSAASLLAGEPAPHAPRPLDSIAGQPVQASGNHRLPLARVIDIRRLTPEQASKLTPIKIVGVVTDLSNFRNSFFVADATGGISVDRTDTTIVHNGDQVEITGTSGPGSFAPVILASAVRVLGPGKTPKARRVNYADMYGGALDSEWIEVEGVIHSAQVTKIYGKEALDLELQMGSDSVSILLQDFAGIAIDHLVDSTVRIRGVCETQFNEKRQFIGVQLITPLAEDLEILQQAGGDPFEMPVKSIREALQFGQSSRRVKVIGIATYQLPGRALYLQDGADGIRIQIKSRQVVQPGSKVEAVGFPAVGEYAPILESGLFRVVNGAPLARIEPRRVAAGDVMIHKELLDYVPFDEQLVQIEGTVEESHIQEGQRVWLLRDGGQVFEAYLPLSAAGSMGEIGSGSVLRLTGICTVHADTDRNPISFGLLLRTPADIVVLKRASWWTAAHTLIALAIVAGGMVLVILWVVILRNRVEKQTRIIRESEERFRNLAHHDFLTGLPNRLMLEDHIARCLSLCEANQTSAVILTIDIDRFKKINDTFGHLVGDECLKVVASRLRSIVRRDDVIARTGGEEFTIVVGGLPGRDSAERIATAILHLFLEPTKLDSLTIDLSVSVGGALYPESGLDSTLLRKISDQALYEAKRAGRKRAVFAGKDLLDSAGLADFDNIDPAPQNSLNPGEVLLHS